jgi:RNA polymerase II subunit A small phosphatase-like protein
MLQAPNSAGGSSDAKQEKKPFCWCLFWCCESEDELSDEWNNKERESEMPARNKTPRKPDRYRTVKLLSSPLPRNQGRKCLVLDLDETLVHSSFQAISNPDYIIPVTINNVVYSVYVLKRPGVDEFLKRMGEVFEVSVFPLVMSLLSTILRD